MEPRARSSATLQVGAGLRALASVSTLLQMLNISTPYLLSPTSSTSTRRLLQRALPQKLLQSLLRMFYFILKLSSLTIIFIV